MDEHIINPKAIDTDRDADIDRIVRDLAEMLKMRDGRSAVLFIDWLIHVVAAVDDITLPDHYAIEAGLIPPVTAEAVAEWRRFSAGFQGGMWRAEVLAELRSIYQIGQVNES